MWEDEPKMNARTRIRFFISEAVPEPVRPAAKPDQIQTADGSESAVSLEKSPNRLHAVWFMISHKRSARVSPHRPAGNLLMAEKKSDIFRTIGRAEAALFLRNSQTSLPTVRFCSSSQKLRRRSPLPPPVFYLCRQLRLCLRFYCLRDCPSG